MAYNLKFPTSESSQPPYELRPGRGQLTVYEASIACNGEAVEATPTTTSTTSTASVDIAFYISRDAVLSEDDFRSEGVLMSRWCVKVQMVC